MHLETFAKLDEYYHLVADNVSYIGLGYCIVIVLFMITGLVLLVMYYWLRSHVKYGNWLPRHRPTNLELQPCLRKLTRVHSNWIDSPTFRSVQFSYELLVQVNDEGDIQPSLYKCMYDLFHNEHTAARHDELRSVCISLIGYKFVPMNGTFVFPMILEVRVPENQIEVDKADLWTMARVYSQRRDRCCIDTTTVMFGLALRLELVVTLASILVHQPKPISLIMGHDSPLGRSHRYYYDHLSPGARCISEHMTADTAVAILTQMLWSPYFVVNRRTQVSSTLQDLLYDPLENRKIWKWLLEVPDLDVSLRDAHPKYKIMGNPLKYLLQHERFNIHDLSCYDNDESNY